MTDRNPPALEDLFRTLDHWRHLPAYRLEPAVAPFLGLFLRDILHEIIEIKTHPTVIPEFPLRIGTLHSNKKRPNQSIKVDYVAFSSDSKNAFFVELKTDTLSFDCEQMKNLIRQKRRAFIVF